jgi:hypothetical protein
MADVFDIGYYFVYTKILVKDGSESCLSTKRRCYPKENMPPCV